MTQDKVQDALREHAAALEKAVGNHAEAFREFSSQVVEAFHRGNKLLLLGNGSLGAIANLIANLFLHRMNLERPLLPAVSLCHDSLFANSLSAAGQADQYFARQLRVAAASKDVVLGLAESRGDESLREALAAARQLGCTTAALVQGRERFGEESADFLFELGTDSLSRTAEVALFFGHLLVELVEGELFGI